VLAYIKDLFREHLFLMVAFIATIIAYASTLYFPHISWDDPEMVFRNRDVISFNVGAFFSSHYVGNYIPLTMLTHAIDWFLFGKSDLGHHTVNLLFHLANGYLVYTLTLRLFKEKNIAAITVIIFLLHPLQSESVNWISELKNLGYALFYLLALLSYVNYSEHKDAKFLFRTGIFFVISCLFKPSAVVLPLSLMCIDILLEKRFDVKFILNKLPFFILAVLFGLVNIKTQTADQFINYAHNFPLQDRISNAGFAIYKYLNLFVIPYDLSVIYPFPEQKMVNSILGFAVVIVIGAVLFLLYKKQRTDQFAIILFVLSNLILVLQFVPFGEVLYADRYMYVAIIGIAWLVALLLQKVRLPQMVIPIVLIAGLGSLSFMRNTKWKNSITLYEDIIKKYPDNFLALNSLGVENMMRNNDDRAMMYFNKATNVAPYNYKGFYNRGLLFLKSNNPKKAIEEFDKVLVMYQYPKAYVARASAYYALMDYDKAKKNAGDALIKDKNNHKAYFILGNCANDQNDLASAIKFYGKAIELNKFEPDYYFKRAIALGKQQNFKDCISDLDACLRLDPNYIDAYYWRGVAKVNLKQSPCEDLRFAAESGMEIAKGAYGKFCQ
jgi:tetratricopeptide (TPR) repeat protein